MLTPFFFGWFINQSWNGGTLLRRGLYILRMWKSLAPNECEYNQAEILLNVERFHQNRDKRQQTWCVDQASTDFSEWMISIAYQYQVCTSTIHKWKYTHDHGMMKNTLEFPFGFQSNWCLPAFHKATNQTKINKGHIRKNDGTWQYSIDSMCLDVSFGATKKSCQTLLVRPCHLCCTG